MCELDASLKERSAELRGALQQMLPVEDGYGLAFQVLAYVDATRRILREVNA